MSSKATWRLLNPLKRAVKKIKVLLTINIHRWRLSAMLRSSPTRRVFSFTTRPGLTAAYSDDEATSQDSSRGPGGLHRTASSPCGSEYDVDKKADLFISNFYRQLQMERQISLQVRRSDTFDSWLSP